MIIKEVNVKSAISKSKLPGLNYACNPYRGCEHGCIYCYSQDVLHEKREWGKFVDVKINFFEVFKKDLEKLEKGVIGFGTVTDCYQPVEKKYEITRKCLEILKEFDIPVCIQTKSSLILRDIKIISEMDSEIGITITSLENWQTFEPKADTPEKRIEVLKNFHDIGIKTFLFIGPILPSTNPKEILEKCIDFIDLVYVDKFRKKPILWERIKSAIKDEKTLDFLNKFPKEKVEEIEKICMEKGVELRKAFG
ncbi:MAG: radical SAM protein [archaeon]